MKKTEFPLYMLEQFTFDIFGSEKKTESETIITKGLLSKKELYQPIKVHLKRLGSKLILENESFKEQLEDLKNEFYEKNEDNSYSLKTGMNLEDIKLKSLELTNTKIIIEHYDFKLEDFNYQWEENFSIIDFITE